MNYNEGSYCNKSYVGFIQTKLIKLILWFFVLLLNTVRIFVNDIEIKVFNGAQVGDAIRAYYAKLEKRIPGRLPIAWDKYNNKIAHDGRLSDGNHIYIKIKPPRK